MLGTAAAEDVELKVIVAPPEPTFLESTTVPDTLLPPRIDGRERITFATDCADAAAITQNRKRTEICDLRIICFRYSARWKPTLTMVYSRYFGFLA